MEQVENPSYSPHLKKVLKSYQTAAMTSLSGPNTFMAGWANPNLKSVGLDLKIKASSCNNENNNSANNTNNNGRTASPSISISPVTSNASENQGETKKYTNYSSPPNTTTTTNSAAGAKFLNYDQFQIPPPFPIQQVPILTAPDQSRSERSETVLEGETISCFVVGGENRLCLPQILNSVLRDFSLQQINAVCDELQIFCSRCNHEQLDVLKATGILPFSAPSCGLITKTDGERLCNALLHCHPPRAIHDLPPEKRPFHFKIYHECFGKCKGIYTPDHYTSIHARCIECTECHGLFTPKKFVGHAHKALENRTCHWGFDSDNWSAYILLAKDQENTELLQKQLNELKTRFSGAKNSTGKRKQGTVEDKELIKKIKYEETYYPYVYDPMLAYLYGSVPASSRVSAFRPWSPMVLKDGKLNLPVPPSFLRETIPHSLPTYLSHGPPVLLNPERVVPHSETERFERHYQPNVALAPPSAQIQAIQKAHSTNSTASAPVQAQRMAAKPAVPSRAVLPTCNSEIELSTDTDETFSDSTTCSSLESPTCSPAVYKLLPGNEAIVGDTNSTKLKEMEEMDVDIPKELENMQSLMEDEGVEKVVQEKILDRVSGMFCLFEQKLEASQETKKQILEELETVRNSKRERLREAAKTKRMLRKEVDRLCEEQMRRDREMEELRKETDALRHCSLERAHEVRQNEHMRSKIDAMGDELMKLQEELFQLRKRGAISHANTLSRSKEFRKNDIAGILTGEVQIKKEMISPDGV